MPPPPKASPATPSSRSLQFYILTLIVVLILSANISVLLSFSAQEDARADLKIPSAAAQLVTESVERPNARMSAVITAYKQPICLKRMIQHLRTCDIVGEIRVNWFEEDVAPPKDYGGVDSDGVSLAPVIYDELPDGISYRFQPRNFKHEAVFTVDVDTYYSCRALQGAYDLWAANEKKIAVGFHPRNLKLSGSYDWAESFYPPFRRNTLFITKGGITHRRIFETYFDNKYDELRRRVDKFITGEDMLMSFVLASNGVGTLVLCLEMHDHCDVECAQNKVASLHTRTSDKRQELLLEYYRVFGNILKEEEGGGGVRWMSDSVDKSECRSNNNLIGSGGGDDAGRRKCLFCEKNEVCPSDVY
jgi:hypothetical protein